MGRVARGNSAPWRMLRKLSLSESRASTSVSRASSIWRAAAWRVSKAATTSAPTRVWVRYLLQVGDIQLGRPAAHDGDVGEAEVLEFPEKADLGVAPSSEVAEERIRAAPQPAARVGHEHARDERAEPRLLPPDEGRLDLVLRAGQLGTVPHALVEQVIERDFIRDQADDALRRLDRGEHDLRVEHEQADQVGRGDEQLAAGEIGFAVPVFDLGQGTAMVGLQALSQAGVGRGDRRRGPRRSPRPRGRWPAARSRPGG